MKRKSPEILFLCSTLGLGHITRDLAITRELKTIIPGVRISWVAAPPVSDFLRDNKENLLPESSLWPSETTIAEKTSETVNLNLVKYLVNVDETWSKQLTIFQNILSKYSFDLIIGDETFRITNNIFDAIQANKPLTNTPFIAIYDFLGLRAMTDDPRENAIVKKTNDYYVQLLSGRFPPGTPLNLFSRYFVGEIDDLEARATSSGVVEFRDLARDSVTFLGQIIRFDPESYSDRDRIRDRLGFSSAPLIVCSVGGSNVGMPLLKLCIESYKILVNKLPGAQMVLVCGPRINPREVDVPSGVVAYGYVPNLIEYFAVCDLAVLQLGLSSTMELIALQKPFVYFPVPQHFEQYELAKKLEKRGIGVGISLEAVSPEFLADAVINNLNKRVDYQMKSFNGAKNAASYIQGLLSKGN